MKAAHTFNQSVRTPAFCQICRAAGVPAWDGPATLKGGRRVSRPGKCLEMQGNISRLKRWGFSGFQGVGIIALVRACSLSDFYNGTPKGI